MNTFLDEMRMELEMFAADDAQMLGPAKPVQAGDVTVAQIDPAFRRLYVLATAWSLQSAQLKLRFHYGAATEEERLQAVKLEARAEALRHIFWITVKDFYNLWNKPNLSIRADWTLVCREDDPTDIPPFLRNMFGIE
jgi:hypothetical protein